MESRKDRKVTDTAKDVLAVKYVTSKPSFWQSRGCGTRETPLSHNECAKIFLTGGDIKHAKNHPNLDNIKTVSVRERWINKLYQRYIKEDGYKQVVILGSGFDIRPFKKSPQNQHGKKNAATYASVKFWEVDSPEVLDEKDRVFRDKNLDKNATYIRADYTKSDFIDTLVQNGLDPHQPTVVILEGNLMYLAKDDALAVFNKLQQTFDNVVIAFDYFPQKVVDMITSHAAPGSNESMWKTGIDDLQDFATQCGLSIVDNRSVGELSKEYEVDSNPAAGAMSYSVCAFRK